jgi:hypothetical protein
LAAHLVEQRARKRNEIGRHFQFLFGSSIRAIGVSAKSTARGNTLFAAVT